MAGILILACVVRIIISIESVMTNLVLYANNKEKQLAIFSFAFGICNLIFNSALVLLNKLNPFTAMLTTGIVEILLSITQYIYIKKKLKIKLKIFTRQNLTYILLSICFIPIALIIKKIDIGYYINIAAIMLVCILTYVGILYLKKDSVLNIILNKFLGKFLQKRSNK